MEGRFPHVARIAGNISMIAGSSIASESASSGSGDIVSSKRSTIFDLNTEELMSLRSWLRL